MRRVIFEYKKIKLQEDVAMATSPRIVLQTLNIGMYTNHALIYKKKEFFYYKTQLNQGDEGRYMYHICTIYRLLTYKVSPWRHLLDNAEGIYFRLKI